ncbi:MAG TPA: nuclear transport factor 2 family protein [Anaerolineae bacterium]|nr:nuclear transport factor 2 family protein [Anaerolineae bacterium]
MSKIELVKLINDWSKPLREDYYTADFQLTNAQGTPPMDRDSVLAMSELMQSAMPDIRTVIEDFREEGNDVVLTSHWEGTFVNNFDLSAMGLGVIPATGKSVIFPTSTVRISFDGDKISRLHDPATGPDAGMHGFLKALGANGA